MPAAAMQSCICRISGRLFWQRVLPGGPPSSRECSSGQFHCRVTKATYPPPAAAARTIPRGEAEHRVSGSLARCRARQRQLAGDSEHPLD